MTRLYALLFDLIVVSISEMTEEQVIEASKTHMVIDVQDLVIPPQIGWILQGNTLTPPGQQVPLDLLIKSKIRNFQKLAPELLVGLYTTNTLLGITTAQSDQMFQDYQDVLIRLREGAWPTALYRLNTKEPSGFVTQDLIDSWKAQIIAAMSL